MAALATWLVVVGVAGGVITAIVGVAYGVPRPVGFLVGACCPMVGLLMWLGDRPGRRAEVR